MNQAQRQAYSAKHIRAMKRMEAAFIKPIYRAIQSQITVFTAVLRKSGPTEADSVLDRMLMNTALVKPIEDIYRVFGAYAYRKTTREINASVREVKAGFGINEDLLTEILAYLRDRLLDKVVLPITQTTINRIREVMAKGEAEGWGYDRIARAIETSDDLTLARARLIVRTEAQMAMNKGREMARRESRWEAETEWISAKDHRTRHSHKLVDGETVPEGGRFAVARFRKNVQIGVDMMTGPGDPHASAENVCNCRCTAATKAKRDENGRLIPKRNISVILPGQFTRTNPVITI